MQPQCLFFYLFCLPPCDPQKTSKKPPKMTSRSLPGTPRRGRGTPKIRVFTSSGGRKTSKSRFWLVSQKNKSNHNPPLSAKSALLRLTCRPRRPGRPPDSHFGPPGGRNLTPRGLLFPPPGVHFSIPCEPLSHARMATLCLLISRYSPPLRPPLSPLRPHTTSAEPASQEGPAECAKRLNPPTTACGESVFETEQLVPA